MRAELGSPALDIYGEDDDHETTADAKAKPATGRRHLCVGALLLRRHDEAGELWRS